MLVFNVKSMEVIVEFKNHAEKEFWEKVLVSAIGSRKSYGAASATADLALTERRARMVGLVKPGVKAA